MFAASDRPTVIYSANRKLLYSNLNENEVCGGGWEGWQVAGGFGGGGRCWVVQRILCCELRGCVVQACIVVLP